MAHAGGKITTNKEEATLKFLRKKMERGDVLTEEQKQIVTKFSLSRVESSLKGSGDLVKTLESVVALKRKDEPEEFVSTSQNFKKVSIDVTKQHAFVCCFTLMFVSPPSHGSKQLLMAGL
jgi:uncharacterized protein (UPF0335 family)